MKQNYKFIKEKLIERMINPLKEKKKKKQYALYENSPTPEHKNGTKIFSHRYGKTDTVASGHFEGIFLISFNFLFYLVNDLSV